MLDVVRKEGEEGDVKNGRVEWRGAERRKEEYEKQGGWQERKES